MKPRFTSILAAALAAVPVGLEAENKAAEKPREFPPMPAIQPLSAEESLKTIQLPPGYHLELVLSEPDIKEPVMAAFDGDGRMFVCELRSYEASCFSGSRLGGWCAGRTSR